MAVVCVANVSVRGIGIFRFLGGAKIGASATNATNASNLRGGLRKRLLCRHKVPYHGSVSRCSHTR